MDFQDHRKGTVGTETGRQRHPCFYFPPVMAGRDLYLFDAREVQASQGVLVQSRQLAAIATAAGHGDFGGPVAAALGIGNYRRAAAGFAGDGKAAGRIGPAKRGPADIRDQRADIAGQIDRDQRQHAVDLGLSDQRAAVGTPCNRVNRPTEPGGQILHSAAVGRHDIGIGLLVGLQLVIIAKIGDAASLGGDNRRKVGTVALGQRSDAVAGQVDAIDFAFDRIEFGILGLVSGNQQRIIAQPLRRIKTIFAMSHLPRRAALGAQCEDLGFSLRQIAGTVEAEHQVVHDPHRLGPFRSLRTFGRFGKGCPLVGYEHGKGDALAIGRPDGSSGALFELGQRKADTAVLIAQAQVRLAVGRGQIDHTIAVG